MTNFKSYLESAIGFEPSESDWNIISSHIVYLDVPKKSILHQEGTIAQKLYFIENGAARFFIPRKENDLTFNIVFENGFLSAYDSFLTQKPSIYSIETITNSKLIEINSEGLNTIYAETKLGNVIGRKACEELFLKKQKRELSLLNQSAEERYLNLFKEQKRIIKEIPLKYIAPFIGVTPQALSRIRRRIS